MFAATKELMFQIDRLLEQAEKIENKNEKEHTKQMLQKFKNEHYGNPITDEQLKILNEKEFRYISLHCNSKPISNENEIHKEGILLEPDGLNRYEMHFVISTNTETVETTPLSSVMVWNEDIRKVAPVSTSGYVINNSGIKRVKNEIMNNAWRVYKDIEL